jgi:hypothetical protein
MVENIARKALKEGMKTWIVTTERLQARFAQLREEIEDVVVEARHEYEHQAESTTEHQTTHKPEADKAAPTPAARRARSSRTSAGRKPKVSKDIDIAV